VRGAPDCDEKGLLHDFTECVNGYHKALFYHVNDECPTRKPMPLKCPDDCEQGEYLQVSEN